MFPGTPLNYCMNTTYINSKFSRKYRETCITFRVKLSYFYYLVRSKFVNEGSCENHIQTVIQRSTGIKMIRAYTKRGIAFVTNNFPVWDRAIGYLIGESMSKYQDTVNKESTISSDFASSPQPASFSFLNTFPESDTKRFFILSRLSLSIKIIAFARTVNKFLLFLLMKFTRLEKKMLSTIITDAFNLGRSWFTFRARIVLHGETPFRYANPGTVTAVARFLDWVNYNMNLRNRIRIAWD